MTNPINEKFWIIWNPTGGGYPVIRHESLQQAREEAFRLARKNPGNEFIVMESLSCVITPIVPKAEEYSYEIKRVTR